MVAPEQEMLRNFLDPFSECTGDYYLLFDRKANLFYFSSNIHHLLPAIPENSNCCVPEVWRELIYPMDREKVKAVTEELFTGFRSTYHLNYRIKNRYGYYSWINSRGKVYPDEDGNGAYILGRLSRLPLLDSGEQTRRSALTRELKHVYAHGRDGFLLMIGVDDLRRINLKRGREFGDAVVNGLEDSMIAASLGERPVYRMNGDCFCTILHEASRQEVEDYFEKIQAEMREQCTISGGSVSLQAYQVPEGSVLLQYAESALEAAKLAGKARLSFFAPGDYERKLEEMELLEELETAVKESFAGFSLRYQAQVRSESFDLFGAETLLRFESPTRGMVSPAVFIPLLERSGLIYPVGLWVIRNALRQCRLLRKTLPDFHVSVNMSYVQLCRAEIQEDVLRLCRESGLPGDALTFEVTESVELQDYPHLNTVFSAWKKEGICISVDDFGTGYSSLRWLKELAIDEIKIDRCFVREIQHSAYNLRLLSNVMELADSCQIRVCCEGVETQEELTVLERLHPDIYQGFLFSKPSQADDFCRSCSHWKETIAETCCKDLPVLHRTLVPGEQELTDTRELEHSILEVTQDILSICDVQTHEIYYLNPAGQRLFGIRDYWGRKCYKVFHGKDEPCEGCPNARLRQDSFYVWEDWNAYCERHFLYKDKLMYLGGRKLRLGVGMDITKREYISQAVRERVEFSQKIVGYVEILRSQQDYGCAVAQVLASIGDFYQAHRAYLFERNPRHQDQWDNTFEWCAPDVVAQKQNLQGVPGEAMQRWLEAFRSNESVIIYNLEPLKKDFPLEYDILQKQDIQRLIAVPILAGREVAAFIGVDNPRSSIQDDSQIRILAAFLAERYLPEHHPG